MWSGWGGDGGASGVDCPDAAFPPYPVVSSLDSTLFCSSSFEVTVDNKFVAYSKLAQGQFPDFKVVATQVAEYVKTGQPHSSWTKTS